MRRHEPEHDPTQPARPAQPSPASQPAEHQDLHVTVPPHHAAGVKGVTVALQHTWRSMGATRALRTLTRLNQADGFDCMSCAWPDPDAKHRHAAEFCENGAKAVAHEGNRARVTPEFFAARSIDELRRRDEFWLGQQGRITHPMVKWPGATHYQPLEWAEAFSVLAAELNSLDTPDEAVFYTSGRASNEAAFMYQLFVRAFGTNNLPDCSNMCHESTGVALNDAIGIGKGSVSLTDIQNASLIILAGQNPGTNHPRMLSALETAKERGARILTINPLREAGSTNFRNPQRVRGVTGKGTDLTDLHLPIRLNGDLALFQAIGHLLVSWNAIDDTFIREHTAGFKQWRDHVQHLDWDTVMTTTGLTRSQIEAAALMIAESNATVWCWAMGLTQHHNSVATIREVVNLALVRGDIGKPGAGLCPVRGHSNVQGDRTMGIWEKPPAAFLDALGAEFGFDPPRRHGYDTVEAIEALHAGQARVFMALGGNFVSAAPDTDLTTEALMRASLTVHVSTTLNMSHLVCGRTALILPTLGRTERDLQDGVPQAVTVEDSMSAVHSSQGPLPPASPHLMSEVAIIAGAAQATFAGTSTIDWDALRRDYRTVRHHIERVVPGFTGYERRARTRGGFVLPHPPRDTRTFHTSTERANFAISAIEALHVPPGHVVLQTLRSHDQFNTTIYGLDDRYRGISGGRRVVFMHPQDIEDLGFRPGDIVNLLTHWPDDERPRRADRFRLVPYETPRGSAAAYYPETNPLVPLGATATFSNTPTSKSVIVRLEPALPPPAPQKENEQ